MQNNVINNSYNEICVSGGGNFLTQSAPTYFHQFFIRKVLTPNERIDDFMEVTPAQRDALEAVDATFVEPPHSFIDQWNAACGTYGTYNKETGFFELNGLVDITYKEALDIYRYGPIATAYCSGQYRAAKIRTNLPIQTTLTGGGGADSGYYAELLFTYSQVEVVRMNECFRMQVSPYAMAFNAPKLHTILGTIDLQETGVDFNSTYNLFGPALANVNIRKLKRNLSLSSSSKISFESIQYLVANRHTDNPITVTVHPNVFAKLTGDTTNAAAAALTPDELGQWMALAETATEKNITFATA